MLVKGGSGRSKGFDPWKIITSKPIALNARVNDLFSKVCVVFNSEPVLILLLSSINLTIASEFDGQNAGYLEVPALPPEIVIVNLANNRITRLHYSSFAGQIELRILRLQNNRISSIDSDAFRDLDALRTLMLGNNSLHTVPPLTDIGDTLSVLSIKDNMIENMANIPACPRLTKIYVTPHFKTLPSGTFDGFKALAEVWMTQGSLVEIGDLFLNGSSTVTKLKFRSNHIRKLPDLSLYTSLQDADFRYNLIPVISRAEFASVSTPLMVRLEGNPLWCDPQSCGVALAAGHGWSITGTCHVFLGDINLNDICFRKYGMKCYHY